MATYDLNNTNISNYVTGINSSVRNEIISFLNQEGITSVSNGLFVQSPGDTTPGSNAVVWALTGDTVTESPNSSIAAIVQDESGDNSSLTVDPISGSLILA